MTGGLEDLLAHSGDTLPEEAIQKDQLGVLHKERDQLRTTSPGRIQYPRDAPCKMLRPREEKARGGNQRVTWLPPRAERSERVAIARFTASSTWRKHDRLLTAFFAGKGDASKREQTGCLVERLLASWCEEARRPDDGSTTSLLRQPSIMEASPAEMETLPQSYHRSSIY